MCQKENDESVRCPAQQERFHSAYDILEKDLRDLEHLNALPKGVMVLDSKTMLAMKAVYHKSCRTVCNNSMVKRHELKLKRKSEVPTEFPSPKKTRSKVNATFSRMEPECIICNTIIEGEALHKASTDAVDQKFKMWASKTRNTQLLAKLASASDVHAMDAFYHRCCYVSLENAARSIDRASTSSKCETRPNSTLNSLAIAQLAAYIVESKLVCPLNELKELYCSKMRDIGKPVNVNSIHSTRFKEKLLLIEPELVESSRGQGRGHSIMICSRETAGAAIEAELENQYYVGDEDARMIIQTSLFLRKHILQDQNPFDGHFQSDCLKSPVPEALLIFMNVLLQGPVCMGQYDTNMEEANLNRQRSKVACALSQLIVFNAARRTRVGKQVMRHNKAHETPFPLYIGLKLHVEGKFKRLMTVFEKLGLAITYNREREVSKAFAIAASARIKSDGVVVPSNMRKSVFTTGDMDNIDQHKQSNLSKTEFHGTLITLTNHISHENLGVQMEPIDISNVDTSQKPQLPDSYSNVLPAELDANNDVILKKTDKPVRPGKDNVIGAILKDEAWIAHASDLIYRKNANLDAGDIVTWAGFNSSLMDEDSIKPRAVTGVLPLFSDKAASVSMVKHAMSVIKDGIHFLNPGQTPVIGMDQPIYAIGKFIQWKWCNMDLSEDQYVLMLGALHIEFVIEAIEGKLTEGSGMAVMACKAGILTTGRAESFSAKPDHHLKRTRYTHQVFLLALTILKNEAYTIDQTPGLCNRTEWEKDMKEVSKLFVYWSMVMDIELLHCRFVRSLREGDFILYVQVIDEVCDYAFMFNQTHYARWLPIHVKDMVELEWKHPDIHKEFMKGNFVVQKSRKKFSLIPKDHSHEQTTKVMKSDGGISNIYDNPDTLDDHILALPEKLRAIAEFEEAAKTVSALPDLGHHEESESIQKQFAKDVTSLLEVMRASGNPFLKDSGPDLITLHTREVMNEESSEVFINACEKGKQLHNCYVNDRLINGTVAITDTIKRHIVPTFAKPVESKSRNSKVSMVKRDASLVTQLFLSMQSRQDADLDEFFRYENQKEPPAISDKGKLRSGKKSDILDCLEIPKVTGPSDVTAKVLDGAAIVHMVQPTKATNFAEYVTRHFMPFIASNMQGEVQRLDIVWDTYPEESLKLQAQEKRGTGTMVARTVVKGSTAIPTSWKHFLQNRDNKVNLFRFLSNAVVDASANISQVLLYSTKDDLVIVNTIHGKSQADLQTISPCNHEEADGRMFLHVADASRQGHSKVLVRTVDSDVVVIGISMFQHLRLEELWIDFGTGKSHRHIPVHTIVQNLGPEKCCALPLFHSYTGCDTTSSFYGIGKKTAWATWSTFPDLTETLTTLLKSPEEMTLESIHMQRLEKFTVMMYSKTSNASRVNEARRQLFSQGTRSLDMIPPTQQALLQHILRALYQAAIIWMQALERQQNVPDASDWGWIKDEKGKVWSPFWTDLADASKACALLFHCGCLKACRGNCKCSKASLRCTLLCRCQGGCVNNDTL
ncbi:MAG: hypothetical protein ABW185_13375 [Sedimenticola sp.]